MKNFTKLGIAVSMLIGGASQLSAQDAGVSAVLDPAGGTTIYPNITTNLNFTLQNFGSTGITPSNVDTVYVDLSVTIGGNQTVVQTSFATPDGANILPGNSSIDLTNNQATDWSTLGMSAGTVDVCAESRLVKNGSNVDTDNTNDQSCVTVTYAGDNNPLTYDIAIEYARISTPAFDTGSYLPIPTFPSQLTYDLHNKGANQIPAGIPYTYQITVAGAPSGAPINASSFNGLSPGGSEPHNVGFSGTLPLTPGEFEICFDVTPNSDDQDNTNDSDCGRYIMGNPDGIVENNGLIFGEVFYNGSELKVIYNQVGNGISDIHVFDASGRAVASHKVNLDHTKEYSIDLNNLERGVYIANISVNGKVMPYRFMVN